MSTPIVIVCPTCHSEKEHARSGRPPVYCCNKCRQKAFYWRFREARGLTYKMSRKAHEVVPPCSL